MIAKLTTSLVILAIIFFTPGQVNAQNTASPSGVASNSEISTESVNPPDGLSYLLKRVNEKVGMFFAFSNEAKVKKYTKLVDVRLAELKYIVENEKQSHFEKSTQRYFTTAGQLTLLLTSKNLESEYLSTKNQLASHIPILTSLRDKYEWGTAEWRFVEDDINYINGYIKDLSK